MNNEHVEQMEHPALVSGALQRKDIVLQFGVVTLVAVLLHQIRKGFAERCNIVAPSLVYQGELFYSYWPCHHLFSDW